MLLKLFFFAHYFGHFSVHKGREEHIMNPCDEHSAAKLRAGGTVEL